MKNLIILLSLVSCGLFAQTAGQSVINKKNVGSGYTLEAVTLSNGSLLGRNSGGSLASFSMSTGGNGAADADKLAVYRTGGALRATTEFHIVRPSALVPGILKMENGDGGYLSVRYEDGGIGIQDLLLKAGTMIVEGGSGSTLTNLNASNISSGTLAVANGGTGSTSLTANNVLLGNGTSAMQAVAPGTSGNVLTSNGTTWVSSAAAGAAPGGSGSELQYRSGASTFGAVAGSSVSGAAITLGGVLALPAGSAAAPSLNFGDGDTGLYSSAADTVAIATAGAVRATVGVSGGVGTMTLHTTSGAAVYTASGGNAQLGTASVNASLTPYWNVSAVSGNFASTNRSYTFSLGGDVTVAGDAADVWAHRRGTNAQEVRVYNTDNGANDEYFSVDWKTTSNVAQVGTYTAGTGTARDVALVHGGSEKARVGSGGFVIGSGGAAISKVLTNTATLDYDLTALTVEDKTITVTGAADGDVVVVGIPNGSITTSAQFTGWVSAADTVTIRCRTTAVGENPASGTFRATVIKH